MSKRQRFVTALAAASGVAALAGGPAPAQDSPPALGEHVAACAREHLGKRDNPPTVTCTHDGTTMTFATFGEMVLHMQEHHG